MIARAEPTRSRSEGVPRVVGSSGRALQVLFLCTGNSARSILAEALLDCLGEGRFRAFSAGSRPAGAVNPLAIEQLREHGLPFDGLRSKSWEEFREPAAASLDLVITVCDDAAKACPVWPGGPPTVHWGLADPAAVKGSMEARREAFRRTCWQLERRIRELVKLDVAAMAAESLRSAVAAIAARDCAGELERRVPSSISTAPRSPAGPSEQAEPTRGRS